MTRAAIVIGDRTLTCGARTLVMGVINATPDSFSGDGIGGDVGAAVARAREMVRAGADLIDIGGESTRPHAQPVDVDEEISRVVPVVSAVAREVPVPVSIDTRHSRVAATAIEAGATIVNDIWGLRGDPQMASVVASAGVALVAMHNQSGTAYGDLIADVRRSLEGSLRIAEAAGIDPARVILDPGFGFGKTPEQNLELIRRLAELAVAGRPLMVGASRKSTVGLLLDGAAPDQRVEGSLALAVLACAAGADLVRVHDVAETVRALRVADAVVRGVPEPMRTLPAPGPTL